jgi:hypothetical protein
MCHGTARLSVAVCDEGKDDELPIIVTAPNSLAQRIGDREAVSQRGFVEHPAGLRWQTNIRGTGKRLEFKKPESE